MTLISFSSASELKSLKTPQTPYDGLKFIVMDSFYTYDVSGNQITMVKGEVLTIDRVRDGYIIFNGSIEVSMSDLKSRTRPFAWTRSSHYGHEKATIYPWK